MEAFTAERSRREQVSARLAPDVITVSEEVAEAERHPVAQLVRNIVSDWAKARLRRPPRTAGTLIRSTATSSTDSRIFSLPARCGSERPSRVQTQFST